MNSALPHWLTLGFTGHRKLAHLEHVAEALRTSVDRIAAKYPRLAGVSSVASGSDTIFAEEMARRWCPFSLILPFSCERFHQDFKDEPQAWERAWALMEKASHVEVIYQMTGACESAAHCAPALAGSDRSGEQRSADAAAYMDTGYRTIDQADVIIAVWDGEPEAKFGGTAAAVEYARAILRPLIIIDPETGKSVEERMESLADHAGHQKDEAAGTAITDSRGEVQVHFQALTTEAKEHGPWSRFLMRICLQLFLLASAFGFAKLVFELEGWPGFALGGAAC